MQIVTDRAMDLAPEQLAGMDIHYVPLRLTLDGKTYTSGVDLQPSEFYDLLAKSDGFPTTSQPAAGDFATIYRELAKTDPEILSIHVSSGLSGTINSARLGAEMVPEAHVTIFDSMTLSCPFGWQVEAAVKGLKAGWPVEKITARLEEIRAVAQGVFTLPILKYLIHGGRISHMKGLVASLLSIKPIIYVDKTSGKYETLGQEITFKRSINKMCELVTNWFPEGSSLRVQPLHAQNLEAVELIRQRMAQLFTCHWEPLATIAPILGAHTGPGLVGMSVAPMELWNKK
jgi:DegV family protein with EDD domain